MRKRDRESYDVERGNGTGDRCCVAGAEQLRNLKRKTYEESNGDRRTEGPAEERSGSKTKEVRQEGVSNIGTGFRLGERGVGDEHGRIKMLAR